jgi:heme exporter protein B
MFFAAMTGLSKSFISEEERGTGFLLQISADSYSVFFGKLLFNITLSIFLNFFATALFLLFNDYISISFVWEFLLSLTLASIGLAGATTIISALIAKGSSKNALFPVLAFPILVPLILLGIESFRYTIDGGVSGGDSNVRLMTAYAGLIVSVSFLLFDFVWKE